MKMMHRLLALLTIIIMMAGFSSAYAADDGYPTSYTYNYDYWGDVRESPDAYRVDTVLYSSGLGLEVAMKTPQSMFVRDNDIYVCDTGNNRLLQIRLKSKGYELVRIIDTVAGSDIPTFNTPSDVFVDEEGTIYVCDTNNGRVVKMDKDLNFIQEFVKPTDATYDQSLSFLPSKLVVDSSGRVFVLATNVNKGLVKFESDGTFTGYIGANKVTYNIAEYIWKMYFTTKEQRAQQESFVPTEYYNIYMDDESFIYATNVSFDEYDLLWDNAQPIRRLNGIGNDILIKNDRYPPIGELYWVEGSDAYGPSKLVDITVLENDIYVAVDRTRGRIFGYDSQGIMLWAFGTTGNQEGAFNSAIAIDHMGKNLIVLDQNEANLTIFTPTEYGNLIFDASEAYLNGDYDGSADLWEEVLKLNANYNLAFIGIGRSLMRQEKYPEAMEYFKMAHDRDNYGRAFRQYRKIWVEENIGWMVAALAAVMIIPLVIKTVKKTRWEVEAYERSQIAK
ncbi:MAG: hypothetical protein J6K72_04165 [Clostridia bacterium]|nr:hypothetical protein [Clostridia bacterium]